MSKIKDALNNYSPAFPTEYADSEYGLIQDAGMSLRDYFAAKALEGMLAHSRNNRGYIPRDGEERDWHRAIAEESYEIAHAMMEVRNQFSYISKYIKEQ
jgi:hypothetical protein